jgi:multicomponent Na+:H+ antiporter subunit E
MIACRRWPRWQEKDEPEMRQISLFIALFLFWLALSGYYKAFLLAAGVGSAIFAVYFAHRMTADDEEGHPTQLFLGTLTYYPWLVWEIVKSCWAVTKLIVDPRLPISPTLTRVTATQKTTVGLATYANSITLTPGTITAAVDGNVLTVHALVRDGAIDLEGGGMDQRVTQFEGVR